MSRILQYPFSTFLGFQNFFRFVVIIFMLIGVLFLEPPTKVELEKNNLPIFSEEAILGTDRLGRDNFSLFTYGMVSTMILVVPARALTILVSLLLSLLVVFLPKWTEILWSGISSVFLSVPSLLVALICIGMFPDFRFVVILSILLSDWALAFETISAKIRELQKSGYLVSSKTMGATNLLIFRLHYISALSTILKFLFVSGLPSVVMTVALFSYLGVDVSMFSFGPGLGEQIAFSKDYFDKTPASILLPIFGILILIYILGTKEK
ncbi:MAG: ABC transporter permease [Leptospira sp.]|nr:ABC transporter permease [Leptospira sp.]